MNAAARDIDLADLRPDPHAEAELRWYFNQADGEIGLRSNFGPMVGRIETGARGTSSATNPEIDPRAVAAAGRARATQRALQQLTAVDRQVLLEAYREQVLEDACGRGALEALAAYGAAAALVALSAEARRQHQASRSARSFVEWLARLARPGAAGKARGICAALRRGAEERLAGASRAYSAAARDLRRARRRFASDESGAQSAANEVPGHG